MSAPPFLDIEALLAPIAANARGGSPGAYLEMQPLLAEMRREHNPAEYSADDPERLEPTKHADWRGVEQRALTALRQETKDLRLAGHLVEALVKQHGFVGLRDGLRLVRGLVERCWDFLQPPIEDGDFSSRATPLKNMLDDPVRGLRLPTSLRRVPLAEGDGARFGFLDWSAALKAHDAEQLAAFDRAVQATSGERAAADLAAIEEGLRELDQLVAALEAKVGPEAPALLDLREALEDCRRLSRHVVEKTQDARPVTGADGNTTSGERGAQTAATAANGPAAVLATREDAYRQLKAAADLLQRLEPHSPVPYLVHKAVQLGALPFPQLIRALVRDANVLGELNRELGIKDNADEG
jgi:type VI secretion system protein ImpA